MSAGAGDTSHSTGTTGTTGASQPNLGAMPQAAVDQMHTFLGSNAQGTQPAQPQPPQGSQDMGHPQMQAGSMYGLGGMPDFRMGGMQPQGGMSNMQPGQGGALGGMQPQMGGTQNANGTIGFGSGFMGGMGAMGGGSSLGYRPNVGVPTSAPVQAPANPVASVPPSPQTYAPQDVMSRYRGWASGGIVSLQVKK